MTKENPSCYKCKETKQSNLLDLYGYTICNSCKSKLGLFQDATISRHQKSFSIAHDIDKKHPTYQQDVQDKLNQLEQIYISKKIKLLHIQERLEQL